MQPCRLKSRERRKNWSCCFCCHVRTGTVFFGLWHLMLHVVALAVFAIILRHPDLVFADREVITSDNDPPEPTPLIELEIQQGPSVKTQLLGRDNFSGSLPPKDFMGDNTLAHRPFVYHKNTFSARAMFYNDINTCVVFTFCTFVITVMMVYGALKGKPVFLLPFFCLQIFDFCVSSLTTIGFIMYFSDLHDLVANCPQMPYQAEMLQFNEHYLAMVLFATFIVALFVKAYFIGVVWGCYKYLMLRLNSGPITINYIDTETLLPNYDTVIKKFPNPPPSYATAIRQNSAPAISISATTTFDEETPSPQPM